MGTTDDTLIKIYIFKNKHITETSYGSGRKAATSLLFLMWTEDQPKLWTIKIVIANDNEEIGSLLLLNIQCLFVFNWIFHNMYEAVVYTE